jgi:2-hydroxy-3-keto-5-methylthiopentenyl-1-phosphate phosphatase
MSAPAFLMADEQQEAHFLCAISKTKNIKYIFGQLLASNLQRHFADFRTLAHGKGTPSRRRVHQKMRKIFISDYDGTITDKDFYSLLAERYIPADTPDYFAQYREGRLTHFEAMAAYFAFAPTEEGELEELLEASRADPDLGASVALLQRSGWELLVVSAGSSWYVERVLGQAGVTATVYSNPGRVENGRGLVLEKLDPSSPYHSASVGVDKSAVVRHALSVAQTVAFAGDGPPDLQPALLVRPELRFARGFLADALRQRGEAFRPFSRWSEIVNELI